MKVNLKVPVVDFSCVGEFTVQGYFLLRILRS